MQPNALTITKFYTGFAQLDTHSMAQCYAEHATFDDEAFSLRGKADIMGMWRMLAQATRAKGMDAWRLEFCDVQADASRGQAHWDAHYRFSATGRLVHNRIDACFTFNEQHLITTHRDRFNFWDWSRQALGTPGLLLGWTPFLRHQVQQQAASNLARFVTQEKSK